MWDNRAMEYPNVSDPQVPHLTKTELAVLKLVATGMTSKAVADKMELSKRTVDFHLSNVYDKLAVENRLQAANKARAMGLLE